MKLEIRELSCSDWDEACQDFIDLEKLPKQKNVELNLFVSIGLEHTDYVNYFYCVLRTGSLAIKSIDDKYKYIFLEEYDYFVLKSTIENIVNQCVRNNWNESVDCLKKHFLWEYEGYEI